MNYTTNDVLFRVNAMFADRYPPEFALSAFASSITGIREGDIVEAYTEDDDPCFSYLARVTRIRPVESEYGDLLIDVAIIENTRREWRLASGEP